MTCPARLLVWAFWPPSLQSLPWVAPPLALAFAPALVGELDDAGYDVFKGKASGVEDDGAGGGLQGRGFALVVASIAGLHSLADAFQLGFAAGLEGSAAGPLLGRGRKVDLELRVGQYDRPN